jgi:hypothetical protein
MQIERCCLGNDWHAQLALIASLVRRQIFLPRNVRRGVELAKVRALELSAIEEALVLGGNLLRLIRRVRRMPAAKRPRAVPRHGGSESYG